MDDEGETVGEAVTRDFEHSSLEANVEGISGTRPTSGQVACGLMTWKC